MKRIVLLGATGSVGQQTLDVVRAFRDQFDVVGLAATTNREMLSLQAVEFDPEYVCFSQEAVPEPLAAPARPRLMPMVEMAALPEVDVVVSATASGLRELPAVLAALKAGKQVALVSTRMMALAGGLLMRAARKHGAAILPVDPALSAIWQCLRGEPGEVQRVVFTATDAPRLGENGGVDAMTLMDVGLQAIGTHHLFGVPYDRQEVVIHPEGVVRAMVEFGDGALKAVLSQPAPHLPLQYALSYPDRWYNGEVPPLDLVKVGRLTFHPADPVRYPCLGLAIRAGRSGGTATTVLNAANEVAVRACLAQQIRLNQVPKLVAAVLSSHEPIAQPTLEEVYKADAWARQEAQGHTLR